MVQWKLWIDLNWFEIFVYKAPSSGINVKLVGEYLGPAHRLDRQNREKTRKKMTNFANLTF